VVKKMVDAWKVSCPTKASLIAEWQNATELYSKAVAELARLMGTVSRPEYDNLSARAENARHRANDAKKRLESHIAEHDCDGNGHEAVA